MADRSGDYKRLAELDADLRALEAERDTLEHAWLELATARDRA